MSSKMENCPICKEKKEFNYISRSKMEDIYECSKCSFQSKHLTREGRATVLGMGLGGGTLGGMIIGAVISGAKAVAEHMHHIDHLDG